MNFTTKLVAAAALLFTTTVTAQDYQLISQNKTAYASSQESNEFSAAKAVDGNPDSRWGSHFSDGQWIVIDLGAKKNIDRVILNWEAAYASEYAFYLSDDGQNWGNRIGITDDGVGGIETIDYNFGEAQYFKLVCETRSTPYGCSLFELEIYNRVRAEVQSGKFVDFRDGQTYESVTIGNQTWMAENLNYGTQTGSDCYNNSENFCDTYGKLYDWNTTLAGQSPSATNPSNVQGICPEDWHLPSTSEWQQLVDYVDLNNGSDDIGKSLKAEFSWQNNNNHSKGNGIDEFGFGALAGGGNSYGHNHLKLYGYFWTSSEVTTTEAGSIYMSAYVDILVMSQSTKSYKKSVRCVKD